METRPTEECLFSRSHQLARLADPSVVWDLVVIGGGASGLGVALDAVSRGYKVALAEGSDFAKGTSSRSTKLIHGGVRYLAQGNIKLVREASVERGLLLRNAPHLVRNQTFIIPVYRFWDSLRYTIGLKLYDWIAGTLSLGSSVYISREEVLEAVPGIRGEGLLGGVRYQDGQFDDARLAVNLVQTVMERGGCAVNYLQATGLLKARGKVEGVMVLDRETGTTFPVKAKAVVNATGVFADDILRMDDPAAGRKLCVSQGVHLVIDGEYLPSGQAVLIPETPDGRVLFAVPWHHKVVLGTTDTPAPGPRLEPQALEEEVRFILDTAAAYLTRLPDRAQVCSVFAGLRPLVAPGPGQQKTKEISRSHKIIRSASDLFTLLGGKWTTFRRMGEDLVDAVERDLGWKRRRSRSAALSIHGHIKGSDDKGPFWFYGSDASLLEQRVSEGRGGWISKSLRIHSEQVVWAVEREMARTVEDVLARRTRALFLDARESIRICEEVARLMAAALHEDRQWVSGQVESFTALAQRYLPDGMPETASRTETI